MNKLVVVMATDENYIIPTKVAMSSILDSASKDSLYEFHILCNRKVNENIRQKLIVLEETYEYLKILFHEIEDIELNDATINAHVSLASYYRLYISRIIDEERCFYVDSDMIIREDLLPVYHTDLHDYYVAAVRDMGVQANMKYHSEYADCLEIASMKGYVNAGFMLLNLKKIREDGLDKVFISAIKCGYKYMDQDIINKYCYGSIKYLPLRYDYFTEFDGDSSKEYIQYYPEQELEGMDHTCVLHYAGIFKPWLCTRLKMNQYWWNQAKKILSDKEYQEVLTQAHEFERKSDWTYILEKTEREKNVVIFGFSEIGKNVANLLRKAGHNGIAAYADNDTSKHGMEYQGITVLSVEDICLKFSDPLWIISSQNSFIAIGRQLQELGIGEERIIRYIWKDKTYYDRLDDKYRAYELQILDG